MNTVCGFVGSLHKLVGSNTIRLGFDDDLACDEIHLD